MAEAREALVELELRKVGDRGEPRVEHLALGALALAGGPVAGDAPAREGQRAALAPVRGVEGGEVREAQLGVGAREAVRLAVLERREVLQHHAEAVVEAVLEVVVDLGDAQALEVVHLVLVEERLDLVRAQVHGLAVERAELQLDVQHQALPDGLVPREQLDDDGLVWVVGLLDAVAQRDARDLEVTAATQRLGREGHDGGRGLDGAIVAQHRREPVLRDLARVRRERRLERERRRRERPQDQEAVEDLVEAQQQVHAQ